MVRGLGGPARRRRRPLVAQDIAAATATIITGGGSAMVSFATAPEGVGQHRAAGCPGRAGPYNLTADSGGGPQSVRIATDPTALPSITISSGGGPLQVEPSGGAG